MEKNKCVLGGRYIGFIPETKFSNELSLADEIDIIMKDIKEE
ncbi:Protein of unknown function [Lactobacillus acidophilus DSM 20079 = JCM 1132 = NBRC 13951 = CIP 76.13]|nr:hypothetical protein LA14_1077 [Lactobacillus acidophilus La-14]CDF67848.1 Protein of unknown function [Lactobacillus acidophilus DSM 20079 = JCM 1132 = NBRC 13951 = CIP 76.13]CDF71318.1 Protein of unknown function [Lactobacillus acidophilus CIRM-BIA 445]CDF75137.1 Protein of unknown function [Lactobacillus acidophilus DSM 20242]